MAIRILVNISRSKGNQTMKYGQVVEQEKHFSSKTMQNMRTCSSRPLFFFKKKALNEVKASGLKLS